MAEGDREEGSEAVSCEYKAQSPSPMTGGSINPHSTGWRSARIAQRALFFRECPQRVVGIEIVRRIFLEQCLRFESRVIHTRGLLRMNLLLF